MTLCSKLSLGNFSPLGTDAPFRVGVAGEGRAGAWSQAVQGVEGSFPPSREEPILGKTSK